MKMQLGYVPSLSTERPSMGKTMSALGYETAYLVSEVKGTTLTPPPRNTLYQREWEFQLSPSRLQPVDGRGQVAPRPGWFLKGI
jgi:hypothetical protein